MDAAVAQEVKHNIFGVRLDFAGGMSVSKGMLRSVAFQKFVQTLKSENMAIKMTLPKSQGDLSSFFMGVPAAGIDEPETAIELPPIFHDKLDLLRQFLQENAIPVAHESQGLY